jgi:hypothetical protein
MRRLPRFWASCDTFDTYRRRIFMKFGVNGHTCGVVEASLEGYVFPGRFREDYATSETSEKSYSGGRKSGHRLCANRRDIQKNQQHTNGSIKPDCAPGSSPRQHEFLIIWPRRPVTQR